MLAPLLDRLDVRRDVVAVEAEALRRRDRVPRGVLEVAQGDDVPVAVGEFFAGWISRSVSAGEVAFESSSDQISWRSPVWASIRTIGCLSSKEAPMRVIGTAPVALNAAGVSIPGTWSTIMAPG